MVRSKFPSSRPPLTFLFFRAVPRVFLTHKRWNGEWWRTYDGMKDKNEWELNPKATATMKSLLEQEPEKLPTAGGGGLVYRVSPKFLATTTSRFDVPLPEKDSLGGPTLQIWSLLPEEELVMVPHLIAQMFARHVEERVLAPHQSRWLFVGTPGIGKSFSVQTEWSQANGVHQEK